MSVQKYDLMSCLKKAARQCAPVGTGLLHGDTHAGRLSTSGARRGRLASRGKQRLTVSRVTRMEGSGFKVAVYGGDVSVDRLPVGTLRCDHVIHVLKNRQVVTLVLD